MSRKEVIMVTCDRCKREELQPSNGIAKVVAEFECSFDGQKIVYHDLCGRCRGTIANHVEFIREWERELRSLLGPVLPHNEAPPVTPAPDYSPPKPHSGKS